ncbi:MAG: hypothetical protein AB8G05_25025 [Oligoflexales bacterium]
MSCDQLSSQKSLTSTGISLYLFLFCLSLWGIHNLSAHISYQGQVLVNLGLTTILSGCYLYILTLNKPKVSIQYGAALTIISSICAPIILQTDPFRYVWDGLHSFIGINPYLYTPENSPLVSQVKWSDQINHPYLPTIYPPAAQFFFHLSAYFNPWTIESVSDVWRLMFGWKLIVGIASSGLFYCYQGRRWDLVLLHPLFLLTVIGNAHLDILMITAVGSFLCMKSAFRSLLFKTFWLAIAILCKWLPLLYLPAHFMYARRKHNSFKAVGSSFLIILLVLLSSLYFVIDRNVSFFYSLGIYAQHWIFFPYAHAIFSWIFSLFGFQSFILLGKIACLAFGVFLACILSLRYWQGRLSLRLYLLLLSVSALGLSPTIHPWYLLILLPLGVPYFKVLLTPWVWPILGLFSQSYYLYDKELLITRWGVYGLVSLCIAVDGKKLHKKLRSRPVSR